MNHIEFGISRLRQIWDMDWKCLTEPKRGSKGGTITNNARKVLGQPIVKPINKMAPGD
jgi:hypothetical protein